MRSGVPEAVEYRIDELARLAGTSVRNVRAYQDRGLIPAPRRTGRVGMYSEAHLARLRLIGTLLERGYTLANIAELTAAWEQGQDMGALLGFEAALAPPRSGDVPASVTAEEVAARLGRDDPLAEADLARLVELEVLAQDGDRYFVTMPSALEIGALLARVNVPLAAILETGEAARDDMEVLAGRMVDLVQTHVIGRVDGPFPTEEIDRLVDLVARLRPLAMQVVEAGLSRAMGQDIRSRFGDYIEHLTGPGPTAADEAS
jgi:DNA-binding transcriptional MerR regulator